MIILLSPAKTLDLSPAPKSVRGTQPRFKQDIEALMDRCKKLEPAELKQLMKLSDSLAELNHQRFQEMSGSFSKANAKPCLLAFQGDVYRQLDAASLAPEDLAWAQQHLRIISGLYGLLRPLDLMQPYRLEMGTRLDTERGKNLYEFWGSKLASALNREVRKQPNGIILSLASNEYSKAVTGSALEAPMITAHFQEVRNGEIKTIGFSAKQARGMMARFVIENRIDDTKQLKKFRQEGYRFRSDLSSGTDLRFVRDQQAA